MGARDEQQELKSSQVSHRVGKGHAWLPTPHCQGHSMQSSRVPASPILHCSQAGAELSILLFFFLNFTVDFIMRWF